MAKRPYIQFYIGDYLKDTRVLPLNVRGAWVDLILYMWDKENKGELIGTLEEFSRLMCCSLDEADLVIQTLKQKDIFDYDALSDGRIKIVSRKQKKMVELSQTRSKAGKSGGNPALIQPKEDFLLKQNNKQNAEYEYENNIEDRILESRDKKGGVGEREGKWNQMPGPQFYGLELPAIKAGAAIQLINITNSTSISQRHIDTLWDVFKKQHFTGKKFYESPEAVYSHFINWSKTQKINGKTNWSGSQSPTAGGQDPTRIAREGLGSL